MVRHFSQLVLISVKRTGRVDTPQITFFGPYPTKSSHLKLVRDPKEVLLNFYLDICSMGWDGREPYLLPRAVRALQSHALQYQFQGSGTILS